MALLALLYETSMGGEAGPLGTARPFQGAWANGPLSVGLAGGSIFKHGICHVVFVIALFIQLTIYVADVVRFEHVRVEAIFFKCLLRPIPHCSAVIGRLLLPSDRICPALTD